MGSTLKFDVAMSVMSVLTLCLLVFVLYLVRKVHKLVGFSDLPMLFQVIAIAMSITCLLIYCILGLVQDFVNPNGSLYYYLENSEITREIDFFKVEFLFSALLFDLYKWSVFLLATNKARTAAEQSESEESMAADSLKQRVKALRVSLVSAQCVIFSVATVVVTIVLALNYDADAIAPYIAFQYY